MLVETFRTRFGEIAKLYGQCTRSFGSIIDGAGEFFNYFNFFFNNIFIFQTEIALSLQQLGSILGDYKDQQFPLDHGQTEFPAVVDKFHRTVLEVCKFFLFVIF